MELRVCLAVLCTVAFLFCSVSAAGISFNDIISGGSSDAGISVPQLPRLRVVVSFREKHWTPIPTFSRLPIVCSGRPR